MKKQWATSLLFSAILMSFSAVVAAQPQDHRQQDQRDQRGHQDQHGRQDRNDHQRHRGMSDRGRSEGWYKKGGRMPSEYRGRTYVVSDWRSDHLRAPPRGYHWVRSDNGDFLLVAITSGIIADLLLHH
jgi:Ni/Co efflux regulator RcnB